MLHVFVFFYFKHFACHNHKSYWPTSSEFWHNLTTCNSLKSAESIQFLKLSYLDWSKIKMFYSSISIITERFHLLNICTNYQSVWKLSYVVKITSWLQASSHCTAHPTPSTLHYARKYRVGRHSGGRETGADGLYSQEAAAGAGVRGLHVRGDHRHHGRQRPPRRIQQRSCGLRGTNLNLLFH